MNKSIPRISYELRWICKVHLNLKGCSELGTTTPKPETHPHQLQIAWAETCQTYPKVFNNLVVFGLVDSCGLAGVSPLAKTAFNVS